MKRRSRGRSFHGGNAVSNPVGDGSPKNCFIRRSRRGSSEQLCRADRGAGGGVAGDPGRARCADRGADRLGQDAGRVSRGDRRAGAAGARRGTSRDETQIVYVSPLKALSNDIQRNLEAPLAGIRAALAAQGLPDVDIRAWVRTGDTPPASAQRMRRRPPHIVVTTPESLYILLGSESGRAMLKTTRTVIVDEIHALAPNKRGAHLALSLERLAALVRRAGCCASDCRRRKSRSRRSRAFWSAPTRRDAAIIDTGHVRRARARARGAGLAARGGHVGRGLGGGLRPARRADRQRIARR